MAKKIILKQLDTSELCKRISDKASAAAMLENKPFDRDAFLLSLLNLEIKNGAFYTTDNKTLFGIAQKIGAVGRFETYQR